uniref:T-complex protein 1 subunit gamma n=1 Tax=Macrostomum lignano TaxID=282301 RepID=A0A1I8HM91_9PLAT
MSGGTPVIVLNQNTKREQGRKVQLTNIQSAKTVADVIRTCLGPQAMLKMLMDPMGGIVMTNDGNAILREITVQHPAAKSMIEIARTQDEEVGDGTTSVIILAGEILAVSTAFLEQSIHPTIIITAYRQALEDMLEMASSRYSVDVDTNDTDKMHELIRTCLGTRVHTQWNQVACRIALDAVRTVHKERGSDGQAQEIDIKRYARIEKIPGGSIEDSCVLDGIMINKDVVHPQMRRRIANPRIVLLDCDLEYKKGESQTNVEIRQEEDFTRLLQLEEEYIKTVCQAVLAVKPDLVITEKGVSDLAQHYLVKAGVSVLRRLRRTDQWRVARAIGATICRNPKACTIVLRGPSKDILNEMDRSLNDALNVARNIVLKPKLCPGGGAFEMAIAHAVSEKGKALTTVHQGPYRALAAALEVIPRTLIQNCGANVIRTLTALRAKHAGTEPEDWMWGVDGETGKLRHMKADGIWEPLSVKNQVLKTATETAILLLRIDDIVSGTKKGGVEGAAAAAKAAANEAAQPAAGGDE